MNSNNRNNYGTQNHPGIVLLVTLVLLVVLSTLGYTLSSRLSAQRHRDQYIIDYSTARYGCYSAVKYALATLEDIQPQLINRPNEPDFSDLFALNETQYKELIAQVAESQNAEINNNFNDINDINNIAGIIDFDNLSPPTIRGPYGPAWPFLTEPVEFEIGSATVKIEIEDENAKYPIGWALLDNKEIQRETEASLETFCEWMEIDDTPDISLGEDVSPRDLIKQELAEIGDIKPFKLKFEPITRTEQNPVTSRVTTRRSRRTTAARVRTTRKTISDSEQADEQADLFSKLFHSSLFERATELLAEPTLISESREESALKYIGIWGSRKVNVNTAPRHVLEAAFAFGGPSDAPAIAEAVIRRRRIQPFNDIEDLRQTLLSYSDSINKCENYITTTSSFFTIRVTAVSGVAETSSVIAITKNGKNLKRVAIISG